VKERYSGYDDSEIGRRIRDNDPSLTLADLASHARDTPEPPTRSAQQEKYESIFNAYF